MISAQPLKTSSAKKVLLLPFCSVTNCLFCVKFCRHVSINKKTWHAAQDSCRKAGAELVSILSMKEQSVFLKYFYIFLTETSDVWTGLNDLMYTGYFMWSDRHLVSFTYWAPGEPNNHDGFTEDCVEMLHTTGRWNDVSCTELNTYICKMPKAHYPLPKDLPAATANVK
uniref:C-type lectin domain-containing protein n=1 Tax=Periophthalmus magnuspinnatus TaxID=409849 RepID=A0A3B3Z7M1_9GOBI